ncbi:hypothetical protein ACFSFZ_10780 [Mixta tenebrionis]|uniref:Uncharacterized protein n=1 Tax=Mixta tenebrionis TaxID=2562439 RepID=A0A506VC79_9GAMM|nr:MULTISPECIES: hypothetical protein [Mixta]QHM75153.1 hypothetical protein C7M52_01102 [Mixta theicola]TPW43066.1 hypothetical protein FKM52_05705 [Mixta tenebrionis]
MNRSDDEKLKDIMMGEAVLALLHGGGAVSVATLIAQLQALGVSEQDDARRLACERAVAEVRASASVMRERNAASGNDGENVQYLFAQGGAPDDSKKH